MSSSTQHMSKLLLLAASFYLALNIWKIILEERNLDFSDTRNSTQWVVELKNKENILRQNMTHQFLQVKNIIVFGVVLV